MAGSIFNTFLVNICDCVSYSRSVIELSNHLNANCVAAVTNQIRESVREGGGEREVREKRERKGEGGEREWERWIVNKILNRDEIIDTLYMYIVHDYYMYMYDI